jgi:predicted ribosome quality control (RQC) complex YloA/Tae2 family protein
LTREGFARKLALLLKTVPSAGSREVEILKSGRHFQLSPSAILILGRDQKDNERLEELADAGDMLLRALDHPGPTGLLLGPAWSEGDASLAARILVAYGDSRPGSVSQVAWSRSGKKGRMAVPQTDRETFRELMIA